MQLCESINWYAKGVLCSLRNAIYIQGEPNVCTPHTKSGTLAQHGNHCEESKLSVVRNITTLHLERVRIINFHYWVSPSWAISQHHLHRHRQGKRLHCLPTSMLKGLNPKLWKQLSLHLQLHINLSLHYIHQTAWSACSLVSCTKCFIKGWKSPSASSGK